jgi:hypothetical protein
MFATRQRGAIETGLLLKRTHKKGHPKAAFKKQKERE